MSKTENIIIFTVIGIVALLIFMSGNTSDYLVILRSFIPRVEGFSSKPYWDNKQWTWGYGTRVPGSSASKNVVPTGTISRDDAFNAMLNDLKIRYNYLTPKITTPLRGSQLAALLSFAYNAGLGAADKLLPQINSNDLAGLEQHWKQYNKVGGVTSSDLVDRRNKEWQLYIS